MYNNMPAVRQAFTRESADARRADLEATIAQIEAAQKIDPLASKLAESERLSQQLAELKAQNYTAEYPEYRRITSDIARIQAFLRQAQHRLQDVAIHVRSEIRVHRAELVAARRKVEYYEKTILPRAESITELTLREYNAMLVGTYQLLETRTDQIDARQDYVEALRDYWVARSELELAVGGGLSAGGT